ncbi:serine hydrolase domain-containing protein [Sphingosinicella rhizophila]|uniref:Serine hydrolase domain-containing protein n=1 Tax=Sphingosinicella rhizophila TaxID=3050082 RepID=A0ABU3Q8J1_9SPHN|nr:serine hydrolase domain-containing protein [Sphingosinicella sp. GR2756]MDT9599721.1 serine hydrolase domain-containing protein [Sphingosinicella sp. GR2756]
MIRLISKLCAVAGLFAAVPALSAPDPTTFRTQLDDYMTREMRERHVPGAAVAVLHKGEIVVAKGYGRATLEHDVPVTRDTIFQSGSVGKMFTAALVMKLVERGEIGLDDPLSQYLPDAPESWRPITIRHLLTHTSGVANYTGDFDFRRDYTDDELVKFAYALPLDFQPGSRWSYSNTGYVLLGIIVKKKTGTSYLDLLATEVFKPLGMKTAQGITEADIVPNRASGYQLVGGVLKNQDWVSPTMNRTADGSLYFSLNDMIAWARAVEKGEVLSAAGWTQVYAPVKLNSGNPYPYGFGWSLDEADGKPRLHHGGAWQGFRTYYSRYLGEDLAVILLTNSSSAEVSSFTDGIAKLWNPALVAPGPRPRPEPAIEPRVAALIERARAGTLRKEDLPLASKGFAEAANQYFAPMLKDAGPLKSLELVERRQLGDDVAYSYKAMLGDRAFTIAYQVAPGDKVSSFMIEK